MPQYTQEKIRSMFLKHCKDLVNYWANETRVPDPRKKLEGLLFSILVTLDGEDGILPAFEIIPAPHAADKKYHESRGEDYWPPLPKDFGEREDIVTVHGQSALHDIYSQSKGGDE